jgi:hypothetical protein
METHFQERMCALARFKLFLPVLCSFILAAHFLREQSFGLMLAAIISIPFVFLKHRWAVRIMQCFYILATAEWVNTLFSLATERRAMGMPWTRMAIILGAVALFTLGSALVLRTPNQQIDKELA